MATHYWIANVDAPWQASSFLSGSLPSSGDTVIFDGQAQGGVISSLNQTAVDLALLQISREYHGKIGQVGNPLIISADLVLNSGSGSLFYRDGNGTTDVFIVQTPPQAYTELSGATFTRARVNSGTVAMNNSTGTGTITHFEIAFVDNPDTDASVEFLDVGANFAVTNFRQLGGYCTSRGTPPFSGGSFLLAGGSYKARDALCSSTTTTTMTGGHLLWTGRKSNGSPLLWEGAFHFLGGVIETENGAKQIDTMYNWGLGEIVDPSGTLTVVDNRMEP